MAGNNRKKRRRKRRRGKLLLLVLEIVVLLIIIAALLVWKGSLGKVNWEGNLSDSEAGINVDLDESTLLTQGEYTNIALFGLDNRSSNKYETGNSDTIMIASINNATKEVKLVSVYRDTYLNVEGDKYLKANSAYLRGGAEKAVKMLNTNLDLSITNYVCVDWKALVEAIDALGGVDIEISEDEIKYVNEYIDETAKMSGSTGEYLTKTGMQTLSGVQATAYSRVRYTSGMDFVRTSRQRIVLQAMLEKAKKADFSTLYRICNVIADDISTSLELTDILYLAKNVSDFELVSTSGFPVELTIRELSVTKSTVIPADLYNNVVYLHEYLFEEKDYIPSITVQNINNYIINATGVTAESANYDMSNYNDITNADGTYYLEHGGVPEDTEDTENP